MKKKIVVYVLEARNLNKEEDSIIIWSGLEDIYVISYVSSVRFFCWKKVLKTLNMWFFYILIFRDIPGRNSQLKSWCGIRVLIAECRSGNKKQNMKVSMVCNWTTVYCESGLLQNARYKTRNKLVVGPREWWDSGSLFICFVCRAQEYFSPLPHVGMSYE